MAQNPVMLAPDAVADAAVSSPSTDSNDAVADAAESSLSTDAPVPAPDPAPETAAAAAPAATAGAGSASPGGQALVSATAHASPAQTSRAASLSAATASPTAPAKSTPAHATPGKPLRAATDAPPKAAAKPQPAPPLSTSPRGVVRVDGWTAKRQCQFLETLAATGSVERAAAAAGMSRQSAYALRSRRAGRDFARGWQAALRLARMALIDEAYMRAADGVVDEIWRDGELVGERRRRDPRMALHIIDRLGQIEAGHGSAIVGIAANFDRFLEQLADDVDHGTSHTFDLIRDLAP